MKRAILALSFAGLLSGAQAAGHETIALWNGPAPGSENWTYTEESNLSERDKSLNIRNVVKPTITIYPAPKANGTGVLVIPGGGFVNLGYGKEGEEIAAWLNSIGVTAFVLKYRLVHVVNGETVDPETGNARARAVASLATADARQALRIVRSRAGEWGLGRIGVMGFSAGGYLALSISSDYDAQTRPDFVAAIYSGSPPDLKAPADAPPLFLALAADDPFVGRDSFGAFQAWNRAKAVVELHVYSKGGHGFALRKQGIPTDTWNERLKDWMTMTGFLPAASQAH